MSGDKGGIFDKFIALISIEKDPKNIAFAESWFGRIVLTLFLVLILDKVELPFGGMAIPMALAIAACAYSGRHRVWVMPLATLSVLCIYEYFFHGQGWFRDKIIERIIAKEGLAVPADLTVLRFGVVLGFLFFSACIITCMNRLKDALPFRRPIASLIVLFFTLVLIAESNSLHGVAQVVLWAFIQVFSACFCFLGYALIDRRSKDPSPPLFQLGTFYPFWGTSWVPLGKGAAYLRKVEITDRRDLAVAQLMATKLLLWSFIMQCVFVHGFESVIYGALHVPHLYTQAFAAQAGGNPLPWYVCWESLVAEFFYLIVKVTADTGIAVACARMSSFQIEKYIQNPLQSRTIAEFWNRYSYYLKELLVEFFFYPTFLRCFKKHPRLRVFFATFMAAGVGNVLLHFIANINLVATLGLKATLIIYESYAFYAVILACGIVVSQLAPRKQDGTSRWWSPRRILTSVQIILFFCFLRAIEDNTGLYSPQVHYSFVLNLFGL